MRRVFIDCLNKEPKAFNCNYGSIAAGVTLLAVFGLGKGLFWGGGAGAIGFVIGGWLSRQWFLGNIQKAMYWKLPFANIWLDTKAPQSSQRREL